MCHPLLQFLLLIAVAEELAHLHDLALNLLTLLHVHLAENVPI